MGQTATRYFRDKLAMRMGAKAAGVAVPDFSGVFNDADLMAFMANTQGPWLLKPRWSASAIGIKKIARIEELWPALDALGELRGNQLLECFVPGEIFHVEGVTWEGKVLFASPHKYGAPPMQTMHEGGVFSTRGLDRSGEEAKGAQSNSCGDAEGAGNAVGCDALGVHQGEERMGSFTFWRQRRGWVGRSSRMWWNMRAGSIRGWSGPGLKWRRCWGESMRCRRSGGLCRECDQPGAAAGAGYGCL